MLNLKYDEGHKTYIVVIEIDLDQVEIIYKEICSIADKYDEDFINNEMEGLYSNFGERQVKAIIGESPYSKTAIAVNYFGFPEVAFLSTDYSLSLISIMGILFDSIDIAIGFLKKLKNKQGGFDRRKMLAFALWLAKNDNIILINRNDNKHHYRQAIFQNIMPYIGEALIIGKNKQNRIFKKDIKSIPNMTLVHPSPKNYQRFARECSETYFERNIPSQSNGVKLSDFKII